MYEYLTARTAHMKTRTAHREEVRHRGTHNKTSGLHSATWGLGEQGSPARLGIGARGIQPEALWAVREQLAEDLTPQQAFDVSRKGDDVRQRHHALV
jgi:hypothetical protein